MTTTTEKEIKLKGAVKRTADHDGILFITIIPTGGPQMSAGEEQHAAFVDACIELHGKAGGLDMKVQIGDHAVQVAKTDNSTMAVVFVLGHPVVKSLGRMMRRLDKSTATEAPRAAPSETGIESVFGGSGSGSTTI